MEEETAPPGDDCVPCDMCRGRRLKAVHSCLQCLVSYCERHLQPHRDVAVLQKHQLVAPSHHLQDYLSSEHNEVKKMFCRSDQQLVCVICCMDQHKGHDTVWSAAERAQRQKHLENRRVLLLQALSDSETGLSRLQQEPQTISLSAQDAVQRSEDSFTQMILLLQKQRSQVEQKIRDQEKSELRQVQDLQNQVQQDINEMKKMLREMDTLIKTPDHNLFLQIYSQLSSHRHISALYTAPTEEPRYFESVLSALCSLREKIQLSLTHSETGISSALRQVCTLLVSREGFFKYGRNITLDPNTAHQRLSLSKRNRRVTKKAKDQSYPPHPHRFTNMGLMVLSRQALMGRCYWEVEWAQCQWVSLAVSYRSIDTASVCFGDDDQSWAVHWWNDIYTFRFNGQSAQVPGPHSSRLGLFLDHGAGLLSFYGANEQNLRLIHSIQSSFTQPLHVGVYIRKNEETVYFPQIK